MDMAARLLGLGCGFGIKEEKGEGLEALLGEKTFFKVWVINLGFLTY